MKVRAHINHVIWGKPTLVMYERRQDGSLDFITNFTLTNSPAHEHPPDPAEIPLTVEDAQVLMDDLWKCGLRPTEGAGTAGSMAATQKHLEDFRAIAFAKLEVPQPK